MKRIYEFVYRHFRPPYDTDQPGGTLKKLVEESRVAPCWAVDLRCGTGRNAIYLAQRGFAVTGIDFASSAVEKARERVGEMGLERDFVVDDLTDLRHVGGPFQFLVDIGTLDAMHFSVRDRYVRSVTRLAQPGAKFLLDGWEWQPDGWEKLVFRRLGVWGAIFEPGEVEKRSGASFHQEPRIIYLGQEYSQSGSVSLTKAGIYYSVRW